MGEDWGSWFPNQHINWQSSYLNSLGSPYTAPSIVNRAAEMISVKGTSPTYHPLEPLNPRVGQANEPHGLFYGLPRFQQAFVPASNYGFKGKFPIASCDKSKKFLVFDQSGGQTTLIFGSGMKTPVGHYNLLGTNTPTTCNLKSELPGTKDNLDIHLGAITTDQYAKDSEADLLSEMHEDTDELNALLYSDDDSDCGEDDEFTSTGHSPSTMTGVERVGSSNGNGSVKKRKLFEGSSDLPALKDTASSVKRTGGFKYKDDDDAESRCENRRSRASYDTVSEPNNKRARKDKIRETVSILQNVIPCGKGKDAVSVIDEAINYLKSLKMKAKALGLDAP